MAKTVMQKQWYDIVAPDIFGQQTVAETPAEEPEMVEGRRIKVELKDLMPSSDKYYMDVFLKVTDVEGDTAHTRLDGHDVSKEYISKMVSRRSDRIDTVADVETADGDTVRVKVVATTIRKTHSSRASSIRNKIAELLQDAADERGTANLMERFFTDDLQDEVRSAVRKIYPVRDLEIRKTEVR